MPAADPQTMTSDLPGCRIQTFVFDFTNGKIDKPPYAGVTAALASGGHVWLDIEITRPDAVRPSLASIDTLNDSIIDGVLSGRAETRNERHEDCLHLVLTGCSAKGPSFARHRVDVVISEHMFITIHGGRTGFLSSMRRDCASDFREHAQSPGFLVYEIWDHLIEHYRQVQIEIEDQVELLHADLSGAVDDQGIERLREFSTDLFQFRKVLLPVRGELAELSTRKSRFINDATQPFLAAMIPTVERILQDLLVDRDMLDATLQLNMSQVAHKTNEVVRRLTAVSIIFLPLTFLCGIYGMNFVIPEYDLKFGYAMFWALTIIIVAVQVIILRRKNLW